MLNIPLNEAQAVEGNIFTRVWFNFFNTVYKKLSSGYDMYFGGVLQNNLDSNGSVGSGATELYKYSMPAGLLSKDLDYIEFCLFGTYAANANNKELSVTFGSTTIFDIPATPINDAAFEINGKIFKSGSNQAIIVTGNNADPTAVKTVYTDGTEDLSTKLDIILSGTGIADNDITKKGAVIKLYLNN